jgi:transcriptional regulator with XRE-family HTH domain
VVTSPSSSVRQARQDLARRLRDIRIEAGLSARAIARAAGWHESKCSRIEHARTAPSAADIRAWCRVCDAESEIPGLLASLHAADSAYAEWRRLAAGGFRHLQNAYVPLYERTQRIGCYQSHVVPGLLQTEREAASFNGWPGTSGYRLPVAYWRTGKRSYSRGSGQGHLSCGTT